MEILLFSDNSLLTNWDDNNIRYVLKNWSIHLMSARGLAHKTFHCEKMKWADPGIRTAATHHLRVQALHIFLLPFHKKMRWNIHIQWNHLLIAIFYSQDYDVYILFFQEWILMSARVLPGRLFTVEKWYGQTPGSELLQHVIYMYKLCIFLDERTSTLSKLKKLPVSSF